MNNLARGLICVLLGCVFLLFPCYGFAQSTTRWFEHFDGNSSWVIGSATVYAPPDGWQKAGKWVNGAPFINIWLPGHVEVPVGSYLRLRLDGKDDAGTACLPNNPNCTYNGITYAYASGEYRTNTRFGYGCYRVKLRVSALDGVITSFYLYQDVSPYDNIPEIDWEMFGNSRTGGTYEKQGQTNYFDGSGLIHEQMVNLGSDPTTNSHVYGIQWLPDGTGKSTISWSVDGNLVRGPVTANFDEGIGLKVMLNQWPTDTSWPAPGTFNPQPGDLPTYAEYDWAEYIPNSPCLSATSITMFSFSATSPLQLRAVLWGPGVVAAAIGLGLALTRRRMRSH